jgi:type II secretory pathway component PulF
MPEFAYKAVDSKGGKSEGVVAAANRAAALEQIAQLGQIPISVEKQISEQTAQKMRTLRGSRVPARAVEAFSRELSNLLTAGVPLSRAMQIVSKEAALSSARRQWSEIRDDVMGGSSLADALAKWPQSFPPVYVAMIRAGETGGFLDVVLGQIADFRERERDLISKVKDAMIYPSIIAVLAVGVLTFLMTYFIPRFSQIFADFGSALPLLTRIIVTVSKAVTQYGLVFVVGAVIIFVVLRRMLMTEAGRRIRERAILRTPGVGRVLSRFALVRFSRMLGTLLGAGVPLVVSLRVAREAIGNQTMADVVSQSMELVQQGRSLSSSLGNCRVLFPESVVEMIAVAEESGRLDKELLRLAETSETELDRRLRMLVTLAEPLMLFVMAAIVGTIVMGMLLPVFMLQELIH